ncbi:MAG: zf-HC2 domain-containing protein [Nitrospinae bacterium]|nr:zf-HC2 domain-containing protein [Nitrospinota bacterium]
MKCHEIFDRISEYIDRELDPSICHEIEAHFKDCEPCVAFLNTLRKTVEVFRKVEDTTAKSIPGAVSSNLMEFLKKELKTGAE